MASLLIIALALWPRINMLTSADRIFDLTDKCRFMFFIGDKFEDNVLFTFNDSASMFKHSKYDERKRTVLYLHGYREAPANESVRISISSYLPRKDHNVFAFDWSAVSGGNYLLTAIGNAITLSFELARVLREWFSDGHVNLQYFHLLSHSLGSQLAGMIGRNIIHQSNGTIKLPRITGLDPAIPSLFPTVNFVPLNPSDAVFVDVIHTDSGLYGSTESSGTVDFWPNGGTTLQPGCPKRYFIPLTANDLCCHRRSWRFWSESVLNAPNSTFHSIKATNWVNFKFGIVEKGQIAIMGFYCDVKLRGGNYFLQTNSRAPFSRGMDGTKYNKNLPIYTEPDITDA